MTEVDKKPSKEFLMMMIIQLRNCEKQTGKSLIEFLEDLDENDPELKTDQYNDQSLIRRLRQVIDELYPPEKQKTA